MIGNNKYDTSYSEGLTGSLFEDISLYSDGVKREELQAQAVELLMNEHRLILDWGTSVGKSRVAIMAIREIFYKGDSKVLLLVAQTWHKKNWEDEFVKCLGKEGEILYKEITVECYHSLSKYTGTKWDMIIADEAHHLRSEKKTEEIDTLSAKYFLLLSATLSDNNDADHLLQTLTTKFGLFRRFAFTVQEGIDNNFIGKPKIYVHKLGFDKIVGIKEIQLGWGRPWKRQRMRCSPSEYREIKEQREVFTDVNITIYGTAEELYKVLCEEIDHAKEIENYQEMKRIGGLRKVFLGNCKTSFVKWLVDWMKKKGKRFICFCIDIDQAELLGPESSINNKKTTKNNTSVIRRFNDGEINEIFAVDMSKEGTNLNNIEAGIIVQLGNKERDFIQRFGRALRASSPVQHLVVIKDSKDEDFYESCIKTISPNYIREITY